MGSASETDLYDLCRFCDKNLRVRGVICNSALLFHPGFKPGDIPIAQRIANLGLILKQDRNRSRRICKTCLTLVGRLERDLPVFRKWQEIENNPKVEVAPQNTPEDTFQTMEQDEQQHCDSFGQSTGQGSIVQEPGDDESEAIGESDQIETPEEPSYWFEESILNLIDSQHEPAPCEASCSPDGSTQCGQFDCVNTNLMTEKAALLNQKGKFLVNEKHLLQLFDRKCPSCGGQLQTDKVTEGVSITLNQLCAPCNYTYQWKSCVDESDTGAENQPAAESAERNSQATPADGDISEVPEVVALPDEDSDSSNESSKPKKKDSDDDWEPPDGVFPILSSQVNDKPKRTGSSVDYSDYPDPTPSYSRLCTECGGFFDKRKPHTCEHKLKPYCCNICGKRCMNESALKVHSQTHELNYEFSCKYCQATFKLRADKRVHEKMHTSQQKPYKCPDCPETFATYNQRRAHLKDHRGSVDLKCPICGIEFAQVPYVQRHLLVHTGEKPYKCTVCERGFNQSSHLKSHMRVHTGEKPFKCQYCDKSFTHNVSLKSHTQRYHGENPKPVQEIQTLDTDETEKVTVQEKQTLDTDETEKVTVQEKQTLDTDETEKVTVKRKRKKRVTDTDSDSDFDFDSEDEDGYTDYEMEREVEYKPKKKRKSTGRPLGRPKSSGSNDQGSNTGSKKSLTKKESGKKSVDV